MAGSMHVISFDHNGMNAVAWSAECDTTDSARKDALSVEGGQNGVKQIFILT